MKTLMSKNGAVSPLIEYSKVDLEWVAVPATPAASEEAYAGSACFKRLASTCRRCIGG
jgi:hypothetical protein